ncbi:MAG: 4-hydroxy-tetrahydrodipicolinate reductase [Oscillospiraceae bacterium]|nr:4-hydroxy-tetrahydrodipicolinate reductase [Oscillospiraceae bacterium]
MRILVSGLGGAMGREVAKLALAGYRGAELAGGVSPHGCADFGVLCAADFDRAVTDVDCVVDFSHHSATEALLAFVKARHLPLVLATTGHTEAEKAAILAAATEVPLFFSANCSLGVALLIELAKKTASAMPDAEIEIIEKHHDRKLDAPSGTALAIADAIREVRPDATVLCGRGGHGKRTPNEIGVHAIRMGNIVGEHEVMIGTNSQTITLKHEAHSRALFAEGALAAAAFLQGKPAGLYDMKSMISL